MKAWKRMLCAALCLCVLLGTLTACGKSGASAETSGKPQIVVTIFPLYDWTRQILGVYTADVDITLLLNSGADMHSYQPTVDDIVRISNADLFIYVGGESDEWVEDALKEASNPRMRTLNLMEILGDAVREETLLPGMQSDEDEEDDADEPEYDEHIWLSLKNASVCCQAIAETLEAMDIIIRHESDLDEYLAELLYLDTRYRETIEAAPRKTVLFADRFPFRYLADDYGLEVYAAFEGCSAETEASFETVAFLSEKLKELALPAVLTTETGDGKIAETIVRTSGRTDTAILSMDSMQSVTAPGELAPKTEYLSVMEENLSVLRQALGA
ncbi:MAG: zinc ABC transporter substrate-binding protein [Oscillibacter sp.]|nr:zinc ABC transporter substrate-binding protein [Oscillibacter sp.]